MGLTRRDAASAVLAVLVVGVYLANTHTSGFLASNRWAAGAIGVLGFAMCSLGRREERGSATTTVLSTLGLGALALLVLALVTGSQWALAGLALVTIALWIAATVRHATAHRPQHTG